MKSIFLLPILGLASISYAQSSVTVFGILDATIAYGKGSVSNKMQLNRAGMAAPRLGIYGKEDLGSGLNAGFWLEGQISTDDGTGGVGNTNNQVSGITSGGQGFNFARRATVSLSSNFGELRLGRDVVPQYHNLVRGDIFGNTGVGSALNWSAIITGPTSVRASNMISYFSPNLYGLSTQISQWFGENSSNIPISKDGTGTGVHIGYQKNALQLGVAYALTKYATGNIKQNNILLGYDFGVAKVVGALNWDRNGNLSARGGSVSSAIPFGSHTIKIGYSWHTLNNNNSGKKYAIGYVYALSKRTNLYTTAAYLNNNGGAAYTLNDSKTEPNKSSIGFDLGIIHSF